MEVIDAMALHAQACQRFCDLGENVLKLAADGNWSELIESTADALNAVDAVEEGDEELYQRGKAQARYVASYRETHEVLKKLIVTPHDEPGRLKIDCASLVADENDIEAWYIEFENGQWHHWQSDGHGALYDVIFGIAACYTPSAQASYRKNRDEAKAAMAANEPPES